MIPSAIHPQLSTWTLRISTSISSSVIDRAEADWRFVRDAAYDRPIMSRQGALGLIDTTAVLDPEDGVGLLDLMVKLTGEEPYVEGKVIGFGSYMAPPVFSSTNLNIWSRAASRPTRGHLTFPELVGAAGSSHRRLVSVGWDLRHGA